MKNPLHKAVEIACDTHFKQGNWIIGKENPKINQDFWI